ncbi:MAG TPA: chorismate-binding protein [Acidimicrobiia bacterium]|nr:chorismate-binding protein [Acidimicrobiia bacterium]
MRARFDDLRPHRRRSFQLDGLVEVVEAGSAGEVVGVLTTVEKHAREGRWVAGFVAYEAAPAFDGALRVVDPAGTPLEEFPLAWFSVWERRVPTHPLSMAGYNLGEFVTDSDETEHAQAVTTIKDLIRQGETYQVNHTLRMRAPFRGDPASLYRDLINSQSCGYGALIDTGRWAVVSASPELFFEWRHGVVRSKPMKGTAPRGKRLEEDEARRRGLEESEKDQAENLMIVDMVRNDLGRIARTGSVRVPALFTTEKYDTVWQLTSTVEAEPLPGTNLPGLFAALFPCASITGAPKVATMEIIAGLESGPRGVYCGTVGFGGPDAGDDPQWAFNVAIRTALVDRERKVAIYGTGGGVTYDSTPAGEYQEALLKTAVLGRRSSAFDLLETMRYKPAEGIFLLDRHLDRLGDSARYFDIPLDPAEVRAALRAAVAGASHPQRVRLRVERDGTIRVEAADLPPEGPVTLALDDVPVDPEDVFLYHKTTNRTLYDEAGKRHPEASDVILINRRSEVTETTIANLALRLLGTWYTPPVEVGLLPGTFRGDLVESGKLTERILTIDHLGSAEAIARFNSLRGWQPAVLV